MAKLLFILLIGLVFESTGVVLLKKGMTDLGPVEVGSFSQMLHTVRAGVSSPQVLLGVFFEALFFICLLILMRQSDISFLWPLTGLSFVFATFAALWFLHEQVSPLRWVGVILIMMGAGLISYSEQQKEKHPPAPTVPAQEPAKGAR